jgi:PTS system nitrogen regulatory IIA component
MDLHDLLRADAVYYGVQATSKKAVLEDLAATAAQRTGLDARELFTALLQRERLSSTALGRGVAVPHVHVPGLDRIACSFARLATPVDFDAPDKQPVDLVFLLLSPQHASGDHLKAFARIARLVRDAAMLEALRTARNVEALLEVLLPTRAPHAA